jgi:hypothetical protein
MQQREFVLELVVNPHVLQDEGSPVTCFSVDVNTVHVPTDKVVKKTTVATAVYFKSSREIYIRIVDSMRDYYRQRPARWKQAASLASRQVWELTAQHRSVR